MQHLKYHFDTADKGNYNTQWAETQIMVSVLWVLGYVNWLEPSEKLS